MLCFNATVAALRRSHKESVIKSPHHFVRIRKVQKCHVCHKLCYVISVMLYCSLAILSWEGAMSTSNGYGHYLGRNGEFCLTGLLAYWPSQLKVLAVNWALHPADMWSNASECNPRRLKAPIKGMSSNATDLAVCVGIFFICITLSEVLFSYTVNLWCSLHRFDILVWSPFFSRHYCSSWLWYSVSCCRCWIAGNEQALVEWEYIPPVGPRPVKGFVGLKNAGATCYMNSVTQQVPTVW